MTDSKFPPAPSGANKFSIFLLIGGVLMLSAAGYLFLQRRAPQKPPGDTTPSQLVTVSAPLVEPTVPRPILSQVDTGSAPLEEEPEQPTRSSAKAERKGTINPELLKTFFRTHEGQLKACYERRLRNNSMLEGKLDLNIVIHSSGKAGAISRNEDTVRDAEMFECVRRTIRAWQFPKPEGGQVVIAKTFNFKKM
jgi:hypothetical protein